MRAGAGPSQKEARSLSGEFLWNRIANATPEPSWLSANGYVYIK
jgi:hypothetical protein